MDPEHVPGKTRVGEVLPPPPADIPQAPLHYPVEIVPDSHPSAQGDIPTRQLVAVAVLVIVLFGWRPLSAFGNIILTSAGAVPILVNEQLVVLTSGVERAVTLIHQQDTKISERVADVQNKGQSLVVRTQETVVATGVLAQDQVASLSSGVQIVSGALSSFAGDVVLWARSIWNSIAAKWHLFLSGSDGGTQALTDAKEELKAQIRTDLLRELQASSTVVTTGTAKETTRQEGIIVLPKTSSAQANRLRDEAIQGVFSDQVTVVSDETGRSGVVRPIFRSGVGEDYLYVMVPVRNQ